MRDPKLADLYLEQRFHSCPECGVVTHECEHLVKAVDNGRTDTEDCRTIPALEAEIERLESRVQVLDMSRRTAEREAKDRIAELEAQLAEARRILGPGTIMRRGI